MSRNIFIPATLTLNFIICGFFSTTMAANTYLSGLPLVAFMLLWLMDI